MTSLATAGPVERLRRAGVSIWLDDLSRELLATGRFAALIARRGVSGATSNPTIFARALADADRYDAQLRAAAARTRDPQELFFTLALDDVAHAADLLRPVHDASGGRDGFVSFECTPDLAHDTAATVEQATALWRRLARPNVMIKVPATRAGVPAIEELTARGVNVNVTLLFAVERYEEVLDAYVAGIRRRIDAGLPVGRLASVASFFVSRVDAAVAPALGEAHELRGRIAIANAQVAYGRYAERFGSAAWRSLEAAGARPQRPLWASTATKDPELRDVRYVEELVAPDAIVTMPEQTLHAFADHGRVRAGAVDPDAARRTLERAAAAGVDLRAVADELEVDGIAAFARAYREVLDRVERRITRPPAGAPRRSPRPRGRTTRSTAPRP